MSSERNPEPMSSNQVDRRLKRWLYLLLAYASLGMAVLGVILPGLPATEFILLAAWAAGKSSPRLQRWMLNHRLFGPMIRNWHNGGIITRRTKISISFIMVACFALLYWHQPPLWLLLTAAGGMSIGAFFIWRRPEQPAVEN